MALEPRRTFGPRRLSGLLVSATLAACGGGNGTSPPQEMAAQGPMARAMAAPSGLAVTIEPAADPLLEGLTIPADAATQGMWSAVQAWPINAVHMALLPDGQVLSHGTAPGTPNEPNGRSFDFWSPSGGFAPTAHRLVTDPSLPDTFGSSTAVLRDGNLLIVGGNSARASTLVRWRTGEVLNQGATLADDRWYSTALTLADGRVASLGGMTPNGEASLFADAPITVGLDGVATETPQVFNPGSGWSDLSFDAFAFVFTQQMGASTPKSWVAPNGGLFGLSANGHWSLWLDAARPVGGSGLDGLPAGTFGPMAAGAMFAPGRILVAGGGGLTAADATPGLKSAYVVDINGSDPTYTATSTLANARRLSNATVLANGQVLLTGGTDSQNLAGANAVKAAELWNPANGGTWHTGASASVARLLHSTALLLPNGTVLTAGGGAPGPVANENAEVYYPPYLFRSVNGVSALAPRPVLTGINALDFGHGSALRVELASGQQASRLVLVRAGTVSQAFNNGQRFIELPFTQTGDLIDATLPANEGVAPPGHYLLQVLDAAGVPSRAVVVGLGLTGSASVPKPVLSPGGIYALRNVGAPLKVLGFDSTAGAPTVLTSIDGAVPDQARFVVVNPTLKRAGCFSLALKGYSTGFDVRLLAYPTLALFQPAQLSIRSPYPQSLTFKQDTTFCPEQAPGGRGIVLRPQSAPGHVLNLDTTGPRVDAEQPTMAFALGSAFEPILLDLPAGSTGNVAPGAALLSPSAADTPPAVGATVLLQARAEDYDGSIVRVEFHDGATLIRTTTDNSGFRGSFVSTWTATAGTHVITARAFDNEGASSISAPYTLVVGPVVPPPPPPPPQPVNTAPTVTLSAPANGSSVTSGTVVTLTAAAADADGSIASVAFYDGTTLLGTDTSAPYSLSWTGTVGAHALQARATDNLGAVTDSATVTLQVLSQVTPPPPSTSCDKRGRSRDRHAASARSSRCPEDHRRR